MLAGQCSLVNAYKRLLSALFRLSGRARQGASGSSLLSPPGHIFDGQQDERMALLHFNPAGVEQHVSRSEAGKILAHCEIVDVGIARDDLLQQLA
jgi:hypothetical protein